MENIFHNSNDPFLLGTIYFNDEDEFVFEKTEGYSKQYHLKIEIFDNEGQYLPHFHITDNNRKVDCCLLILHPRFFIHGTHKKVLNKKQLKAINQWCKEKIIGQHILSGFTNWDKIASDWDWKGKLIEKIYQPNYELSDENPYDLRYKVINVHPSSYALDANIFTGGIEDREDVRIYIISKKQKVSSGITVIPRFIIEENFSNKEYWICTTFDEDKIIRFNNYFIQKFIKNILNLKQYHEVKYDEY